MFGLFGKKDKSAKLKKQYQKLMAEATELQRKGDIKGFARKTEEAENIMKEIEAQKA